MRLDLAGSRWAGVYWDDGGLLGALQATLPNATLPATSCPLRGRPMWWLRGWRWRRGTFTVRTGRGWGPRLIWRRWRAIASLEDGPGKWAPNVLSSEPIARVKQLDEMGKVKSEPCSISPAYRDIYCLFAVNH